MNRLTAKDVKFDLLQCQAFNRYRRVKFLLLDISKMSVRENYIFWLYHASDDIIRNRYGEAYVKKIQRFEKCDFKLWKYHLDLRFLLDCKNNGVIPKFLRFELANIHLKNSHVCKKCQIRLLEEEVRSKRKRINTLEKIHRGLRKNYKKHFRFQIFLIFVVCF